MRLRTLRLFGIGAALVLLTLAAGNSGHVGWAQSCTVNVNSGQSIQSAINSVGSNSVICLGQGSWQENLSVTVDNLTLVGQGPGQTVISGSLQVAVSGQFTVSNLTLSAGAPSGMSGMAFIPAGSFQMGDSFNEGDSDERPVHTVAVSAFYMDQYEVTKALWDEVASWAAANGYDIGPDSGLGKASNHPVWDVTWYEAVKWANARSEKEGLTPCYYMGPSHTAVYRRGIFDVPNEAVKWSGCGYRLPTEAEWEKAARGGCAGHRFPWCDTDTIQHARANYYSRSDESYDTSPTRGYHPDYDNDPEPYTSPVGSFAPNGYGLYDMAGNLWEWVWDWYSRDYYSGSPGSDPRGPASGSYRVLRGGSWYGIRAFHCRVANRSRRWPGSSIGLGVSPGEHNAPQGRAVPSTAARAPQRRGRTWPTRGGQYPDAQSVGGTPRRALF